MYIQADQNNVKTTTAPSWRLVHNGTTVLVLKEQACVLATGEDNELFVAATEAECLAEIARLGLSIPVELQ
jgi:hypothetical protein